MRFAKAMPLALGAAALGRFFATARARAARAAATPPTPPKVRRDRDPRALVFLFSPSSLLAPPRPPDPSFSRASTPPNPSFSRAKPL